MVTELQILQKKTYNFRNGENNVIKNFLYQIILN